MGYYSTADFRHMEIKNPEEFNQAVKNKLHESSTETWILSNLYNLHATEDGILEYSDGNYHAKFYGVEQFALWLSEYVKEGCTLEYTGENGERWGYAFEDYKTFHLVYSTKKGSEVSS